MKGQLVIWAVSDNVLVRHDIFSAARYRISAACCKISAACCKISAARYKISAAWNRHFGSVEKKLHGVEQLHK
ncbi:hypothetical protein HPS57_01645 [Prevotella sp. PINT]|uniref:hypothetical protein n=1 Tax=Palleniella intestinalis TaxID=2736291 RepID=UPI001555C928|nr:hypothetical protein [Palleniella intestinalis]NPD80688.1 hypothetical protein [Palleniella intestinalis]